MSIITTAADPETTYLPCDRARKLIGLSTYRFLSCAPVFGVRARVLPGQSPKYNMADVIRMGHRFNETSDA
jgi:hypothetical protein